MKGNVLTVNKAVAKKDVTKGIVEVKEEMAKTVKEEKKIAVVEAAKEVKAEVKAEAKKVEEKKAEVKKAEPKKAPAKKAEPKAETKKAPAAKKVGKKEIFVQFGNREIGAEEISKKVEAAYAAEGHSLKASDEVRVYIKPEENMIYYVVNDSYASGINLFE